MDDQIEPRRSPRLRRQSAVIEALGENTSTAHNSNAAEAARHEHQANRPPRQRQIGEASLRHRLLRRWKTARPKDAPAALTTSSVQSFSFDGKSARLDERSGRHSLAGTYQAFGQGVPPRLRNGSCRSLPSVSAATKTVGMAHPVWQRHAVPMATTRLGSSPARSSAKQQRRGN